MQKNIREEKCSHGDVEACAPPTNGAEPKVGANSIAARGSESKAADGASRADVIGIDAKEYPDSNGAALEDEPTEALTPQNMFTLSYKKLVDRLDAKPPKAGKSLALLVMTGAFNPPHKGHLYALEAAAAWCRSELDLEVAGAVISLNHDTIVRNKFKRTPTQAIPARHRMRLCQEMVKKWAWVTVDRWEVTRRAALDYLSVLEHARQVWALAAPQYASVRVFYVCDPSDMIRASPLALQESGFECMTTARPEEFAKVRKAVFVQQANPSWKGVGHVAEDDAVIDAEVLRLVTNTPAVRRRLLATTVTQTTTNDSRKPSSGNARRASSKPTSAEVAEEKKQRRALEFALATGAAQHAIACRLGLKMAGKEAWTPGDNGWSVADAEFRAATFRAEDAAALAAGRAAAAEADSAAAGGVGGVTLHMACYKS